MVIIIILNLQMETKDQGTHYKVSPLLPEEFRIYMYVCMYVCMYV